jgi:sterol desaturase/sphingolipid hydroxylase (fatty acid hydroxylase superfamily)
VKQPYLIIKLAAVVVAVLLVGGFVSYRAGAFSWLLGPSARPAPSGGKAPATSREPILMGGSKSAPLRLIAQPSRDLAGTLPDHPQVAGNPLRSATPLNLGVLAVAAGLSFCFLVLVFRPLEVVFPARPGQRFFRPAWYTDLLFLVGQYLLWSGLVLWLLWQFNSWLDGVFPYSFRHAVASQPWWLQAVEVILLSDFLIYWGHRLQHRVGFLWRFHAVHHSAEHLDWLAARREHPLDTIYTVGLINLPGFILGFPIETLAGFMALRGLWAIYIHSNVRVPIGPLRVLLGSPELHHWHHDRDRDAGNYANLSPLMDLLFSTYRCPDHEPEHFGINAPTPGTYLGHLAGPFLTRKPTGPDEARTSVAGQGVAEKERDRS